MTHLHFALLSPSTCGILMCQPTSRTPHRSPHEMHQWHRHCQHMISPAASREHCPKRHHHHLVLLDRRLYHQVAVAHPIGFIIQDELSITRMRTARVKQSFRNNLFSLLTDLQRVRMPIQRSPSAQHELQGRQGRCSVTFWS